ncbi:MAG TPA: radical SAM protein [Thermoleophilia bacterium]|nr:radical SAM protein [Thermoleophilia bacterium]
MKIRLIEPPPPMMHLWSYTAYPRLGLPMIGAALKDAGHDVLIYAPKGAPVDLADVESCDLVGLSTTTSTAPAAYRMADRLRAHGVPVVIGGSHVTFMPDEALEHADYVARGEGGEELMLELVDVLHGARDPGTVAGLSFRRDGTTVHNALRPPCPDLDLLPTPDLGLIAGWEGVTSMPIMTSWGCPFGCNFCSVTAMFGRKYRFRSEENVMAELRAKRPERIFFYDDNLAANKPRLKRLLRMMIAEGIVVPWQAQMRTDVVRDPELLDLMRRSGCERVALGLESLDQATLDGFDKAQTVADVERAIALLNEYGIMSFGMFVVGTDADTPSSVRDIAVFALRHGITTLMLNILTPLPGTPMYDDLEAQGRILDRDWSHYDAQHVVFAPKRMTPRQLQRATLRAYRRFYSTRRLVANALALRFRRTAELGWCWWFVRSWGRDRGNRANWRWLRRLHVPLSQSPPQPSSHTR